MAFYKWRRKHTNLLKQLITFYESKVANFGPIQRECQLKKLTPEVESSDGRNFPIFNAKKVSRE
jgi:hypothetical protein